MNTNRGALGDSALQTKSLEGVASAARYREWLSGLCMPYLGPNPIEIGSGLGDYAQTWLDLGLPGITVTDIDDHRLERLSQRFAGNGRVEVHRLDVFDTDASGHSALVACNVLEHIPDDVGALRAAHSLVRPGGHVVLVVPAFNFAMSRFDRSVGHVRRYTKSSLRSALTDAGLEVERLHYVNAPGLPAWFVGMRCLRMTPGDGPLLTVWDRVVIPTAKWTESKVHPPFGQSVFAVARVPST